MDIDNYRCFLMVANCKSITEAARKLNMAQPALSTKLKKLSKELGVELLIKKQGSAGVQLTPAGTLLYSKAQELCSLESQLLEELHQSNTELRGTLKCKFFPWEHDEMILNIVKGFHELYPQVKFELFPIKADSTANNIEIDLSIVSEEQLVEYQANKDIIHIEPCPIYAVCPINSPYIIGNPSSITLAELNNIPLILPDGKHGRSIVSRMLFNKISVNASVWSHYRRGALYMARANLGVAICVRNDDAPYFPDLKFIKIEDADLKISCVLGKEQGKELSPLMKSFIKYAHTHTRNPNVQQYERTYNLLK